MYHVSMLGITTRSVQILCDVKVSKRPKMKVNNRKHISSNEYLNINDSQRCQLIEMFSQEGKWIEPIHQSGSRQLWMGRQTGNVHIGMCVGDIAKVTMASWSCHAPGGHCVLLLFHFFFNISSQYLQDHWEPLHQTFRDVVWWTPLEINGVRFSIFCQFYKVKSDKNWLYF